ncbi:hypothetical protein EC991775_4262 [Escherichia coli 99.1775]|nr:hypothetical protein EC991775_4262 [Escherichia coli 99.1775]
MEDANLAAACTIGPFARLRPGALLLAVILLLAWLFLLLSPLFNLWLLQKGPSVLLK